MAEGDNGTVCLALQGTESGELEWWQGRLSITDLPRRLRVQMRDLPEFFPLNEEIFLVIPVLPASG